MSDHDGLQARGRSLEEAFFAKANRSLIEGLRTPPAAGVDYAALSGIADPVLITALAALGVSGEAAAALVLVPMVEMAWTGGELHDDERAFLLQSAACAGIPPTAPCHDLFAASLRKRPAREVFERWKGLVASLSAGMTRVVTERLRHDVMGRARTIAEARGRAGGAARMSVTQREFLDEVDAAFPA